ncbi:uncharacterized protein PV07_06352 [Cladophialophora immunda]|uniref:Uncharacterized protein n=1 Tax=Cladophialophora immunda TaxID=569365 RepID=A0A0D2D4K9_9EURO|nr:uncharacterized protein PV07_06352 [Cladophialophora immunda]KIW30619.1 hypothetical protein PV07_06352 [Cladophialophora immunda]OQU99550.1 hypothetical protein CLAIMM_05164 [Cladophialophora immunda]
MAVEQETIAQALAADLAPGDMDKNTSSSSDCGPLTQDRPRHLDRERLDKGETPSSEQSAPGKTSRKKDGTMMPPLVAPATVEEQDLSTVTNEFMNPNATKIPKESILAMFSDEDTWKNLSTAARENSRLHRRSVMAQILYLSCLKNSVLPELLHRGNLLVQGTFPFSAMSQDIIDNQYAWIAWAVALDETIANALKQINWLDLLEGEYVSVDPLWINFWRLHEEDEREKAHRPCSEQVTPQSPTPPELEKIYVDLAGHNRRRLFLQLKMMQGRAWVARLFEQVPPWIEWEEVVREMMSAQISGQFQGNDWAGGQESGFVEEMEDEEEFEL